MKNGKTDNIWDGDFPTRFVELTRRRNKVSLQDDRFLFGSKSIEAYDDLCKAIDDAGGAIRLERLQSMTLMEFLVNVAATNNIRFYCTRKYHLESEGKKND